MAALAWKADVHVGQFWVKFRSAFGQEQPTQSDLIGQRLLVAAGLLLLVHHYLQASLYPRQYRSFQHRQRNGAVLKHAVMKLANIEIISQL